MGSSKSMSGNGPKSSAARHELGDMRPGKKAKTEAKKFFEGGEKSRGGSGPKARESSEE